MLGEKDHILTTSEMPNHTHKAKQQKIEVDARFVAAEAGDLDRHPTDWFDTQATGGDAPHNNVQPTILLNYIIKY